MNPITNVQEALAKIDEYSGKASNFRLPVSNSLLDELGVNIAIITDKILEKGWMPNGYETEENYRIYLYQDFD